MSTTFGIIVNQDLIFSNNPDDTFEETIELWRRSGGGYSRWLNPLAQLLPDDTRVEPLDNDAQGVFTIGDIKRVMRQQNLIIKVE